jgi:L-iditol 2-dehydrogenase
VRALVYDGPERLHLEERADPLPSTGEVVVAVRASGICGSDVHGYLGTTGRRTPGVVMGHEAAGVVSGVGRGVTTLVPGDHVVLRSILPCGACDQCRRSRPNVCVDRRGLGMHLDGAYADAVVLPQEALLRIPPDLVFEEAALIEPLAVALHAVAITPMAPQDSVAIIGAGPIGLLTLLAVRRLGVAQVHVTDRSSHRLLVARALGATGTSNVTHDDAVGEILDATGGQGADVVFEAVGSSPTVDQSVRAARLGAQVTWIGNSDPRVELGMQDVVTKELTLRGAYGYVDEFDDAARAIADRRMDVRPLIERRAPLDDAIELFADLAQGRLDAVKVMLLPVAG